jgi:hypothetical protein
LKAQAKTSHNFARAFCNDVTCENEIERALASQHAAFLVKSLIQEFSI